MIPSEYDYIVKSLPLFAGMSPKEWQYIRKRASIEEYRKGQVIYKQGTGATGFYCLIRGRVMVSTQDAAGRQEALEYLHRGKYFGVISMLTGEPHSVTAKAINDAAVLAVPAPEFEPLLRRIPQLAIELSRSLSRRIKRPNIQKKIFESTIFAVLSSHPQAGKTIYAFNLALSLLSETGKSVIIIDICSRLKRHRMPRLLKSGRYRPSDLSLPLFELARIPRAIVRDQSGINLLYLTFAEKDTAWPRRVLDILSVLVNEYHFVILDLPCCKTKPVLGLLNQADLIHVLSAPRVKELGATRHLMQKMKKEFDFPESKVRVLINEKKASRLSYQRKRSMLKQEIFAVLPVSRQSDPARTVTADPDSGYARTVRRIARQEGECLMGLALGVGAAYGFCHIGVLKVIEEENIALDMISGASMGAVIASLWSIGKSSSEILEITSEFKDPRYVLSLLDFTFPLVGLVKGNKLYRFLKRYVGSRTFRDIRIPLRIVASDVKKKEARIFDSGSLLDAIMASCAMPGVFAPFRINEEMLLDGGVINPLPTEPLVQAGMKKIIAVNVTPSREDIRTGDDMRREEESSGRWFDPRRFLRNKLRNNIFDILFSSFEILQSEVALKQAQLADIVLHPDTSGFHWLELHKYADLAFRGEEAARKNLERIRRLIRE